MTNSIQHLFANPAFWSGAIATRREIMRQNQSVGLIDPITEAGLERCASIETGLLRRFQLRQIPAFHSWLTASANRVEYAEPKAPVPVMELSLDIPSKPDGKLSWTAKLVHQKP